MCISHSLTFLDHVLLMQPTFFIPWASHQSSHTFLILTNCYAVVFSPYLWDWGGQLKERMNVPIHTQFNSFCFIYFVCFCFIFFLNLEVSCGRPLSIVNGNFTGTNFTVGNKITYHCNRGYRLRGYKRRVLKCTRNGKWNKKPPKCKGM